ncbi:hypothetical protein OG563_18350 [Nocardia vinacea]|uniref:Uncharacterized protein n=1 Tax=Nocardia vinacea TaxID=96468 RepID=A0ABZ1Z861_9NOCA|nr:hypothetical protein [Nocardia vinacea]
MTQKRHHDAESSRHDVPRPVLAALIAFGAGAMVAAVSTELFFPPIRRRYRRMTGIR